MLEDLGLNKISTLLAHMGTLKHKPTRVLGQFKGSPHPHGSSRKHFQNPMVLDLFDRMQAPILACFQQTHPDLIDSKNHAAMLVDFLRGPAAIRLRQRTQPPCWQPTVGWCIFWKCNIRSGYSFKFNQRG